MDTTAWIPPCRNRHSVLNSTLSGASTITRPSVWAVHQRMRQAVIYLLRLNSGVSASVQLSPRILRIFTVCHFSPSLAAHSAAGRVMPSRVIGVAPAHTVLRIGIRGIKVEACSKVAVCMAVISQYPSAGEIM